MGNSGQDRPENPRLPRRGAGIFTKVRLINHASKSSRRMAIEQAAMLLLILGLWLAIH